MTDSAGMQRSVSRLMHHDVMTKIPAVAAATIAAAFLTGCIPLPSQPVQTTTPATQPTTQTPSSQPATPATSAAAPPAAQGTRNNPYPAGSTLTTPEWNVTVGATNLDATQIVADGNMFNDPAPEGMRFIQVPVSVVYNGPESAYTMDISVTFVAASGETYNTYDVLASVPDNNPYTELYTGGTAAYNEYLAVPVEGLEQGILRVTIGLIMGDDAFVTLA